MSGEMGNGFDMPPAAVQTEQIEKKRLTNEINLTGLVNGKSGVYEYLKNNYILTGFVDGDFMIGQQKINETETILMSDNKQKKVSLSVLKSPDDGKNYGLVAITKESDTVKYSFYPAIKREVFPSGKTKESVFSTNVDGLKKEIFFVEPPKKK